MDLDDIGSERLGRCASLGSSHASCGSPVESSFDSFNTSAIQKNITKILNSLEAISRDISEGKAVNLWHTTTVIDMLDHALDWIQVVRTCDLLPTLSWETPGGNGTRTEGGRGKSKTPKKKCFRQMRESLARMSRYPEDPHYRADFVNAAIECMNCFRRHVLADNRHWS